MSLLDEFYRVTKAKHCPICGHDSYCLIAKDESAVICPRTESPKSWGQAGYFHPLAPHKKWGLRPLQSTNSGKLVLRLQWETLQAYFLNRLRLDHFTKIADEYNLGVSIFALMELGMGWDGKNITFPMYDSGYKVIGIQSRHTSGQKLFLRKAQPGLFVPLKMIKDPYWFPSVLYITEGATDTATALDLGFDAIGRANALTCEGYIKKLVKDHKNILDKVVIIADNDKAINGMKVGLHGAEKLAKQLCVPVRIWQPPIVCKDLRAAVGQYGCNKVKEWILNDP